MQQITNPCWSIFDNVLLTGVSEDANGSTVLAVEIAI